MTQYSPAVRYLRDYVAIPSVNPMGRTDIDAAIRGERRYAEHLESQLRGLGLDAQLLGREDRKSVVAFAEAGQDAETILVASHLDTVPVDGMVISPFDPRIKNERVYGRGSCDTKAGMAALVAALERVLRRGTLRRNVLVVGEADEEHGSVGVNDVLAQLNRTVDWAVATEPTGLRLVTQHKGTALLRLEAKGRAGHSSSPDPEHNAIHALARAVLALEKLGVQLAQHPHPTLGAPTLSVGLVGGGHAVNIIADHAWLMLDRRWVPGETVESIQRQVEAALKDANLNHVAVSHCSIGKHALHTEDAEPVVRSCQHALATRGLDTSPAQVPFGTDAGPFSAHGIPSVVMGPGSIEQAHTEAEFVAIDEVESMASLFEAILEGRVGSSA